MAKILCNQIFTYAIPSDLVLGYMVSNAPSHQIAEVGAGSGYWASLLAKHGAVVMANDNIPSGRYYPIVEMDAEAFVKKYKGLADYALFLCWPRSELSPGEAVCMPERVLSCYKGTDVYFVGEIDNGCTFDMDTYAKTHPEKGLKLVKTFPLPNFLGTDDHFRHYRRV